MNYHYLLFLYTVFPRILTSMKTLSGYSYAGNPEAYSHLIEPITFPKESQWKCFITELLVVARAVNSVVIVAPSAWLQPFLRLIAWIFEFYPFFGRFTDYSTSLLQCRTITFCLACCTACVICCGLLVTAMAGIAYGYNYSFAEFITHTRSDVTVYMRRGQFDDNPDLMLGGNRRMGDEDDLFPANVTSDYEEQDVIKKDSEPLSSKWLKVHDIREYVKKLTKYSGVPEKKEQKVPIYTTSQSLRRMSIIPILIPTTVWRSGSTEIVLRNFLPINDLTNAPKVNSYQENKHSHEIKSNGIEYSERQMKPIQPDIEIRIDDIPERELKPISESAVNSQNFYDQDDPLDVENEDSIMYKPV